MNIVYRIILKIHSVWKSIYKKAYIEIWKSRGMKVGKDVIFIEAPAFGSEPYLIDWRSHQDHGRVYIHQSRWCHVCDPQHGKICRCQKLRENKNRK